MCGLVALVGPPGSSVDLSPSLDVLASRGPDGRGVASSSCGRAHLGHTRLALVDPSAAGQQPFVSEDGQLIAIVNGEFYGDEQLRRDVLARGHRLRGHSDSELLIPLYLEHGERVVEHLRGEFAFVLWDGRTRRLLAGRDRFGIKPLLYTRLGDRVAIASNARALFALGVRPAWSLDAIAQVTGLQYLMPGETLFAGVRMLPPGCLLTVDERGPRVHRYDDLDYPRTPSAIDDHEAAQQLAARLDEAVRLRLRGDEPAAFQLSGGIDSAAVVASAAPALGRPVDAFTVSFGGAYDEAPAARAIADAVGARLHVVEASPRARADVFVDAVVAGEGVAINGHVAAKYLLLRAIRQAGYKVVLTGEGADEVLAGYAHLRADLGVDEGALLGHNEASAGLMLPRGEGLPLDAVAAQLGFVPTWLRAKAGLGRRTRALVHPDLARQVASMDPAARLLTGFDLEGQLRGRGRVEQSLHLWSRTALEGYILHTLGDGQEMAHGVEGRLPFLDHVLFGWLRPLPTSLKIRDGVEKFVLRASQRGRLPDDVLAREKHPFVAPPVEGPMLDLARSLLTGPHAPSVLDPGATRDLLDALPTLPPAARKDADPALHLALSLAALEQRLGLASPLFLPEIFHCMSWWQDLYDDLLADLLLERTTDAEADATCDFLLSRLALPPGGRVLDQCCGIGSLSLPLARRGFSVVAVDQCAPYVERGQRDAAARGLSVEFHAADALTFVPSAPVDGVFNWWTSFGYLPDDEGNQRMLRRAFDALRPGGSFLLDFMNVPGVLRGLQRDVIRRRHTGRGEVILLRETSVDVVAGVMHKRWTYALPDRIVPGRPSEVRLYMPHEVGAMLRAVGFEALEFLGDEQGQPLPLDSPRLIVHARRPRG